MSINDLSVGDWQKRLEDAFTKDRIIGGELIPVLEAEREHAEFVKCTFHGQMVLADSFQAFFVETLRLAEDKYRASPLFQKLQWYPYLLLRQLSSFRTVRAAEILFVNGCPGQGYGLLRDLKDRAVLLGAVGNEFTTLMAISGAGSLTGNAGFVSSIKDLKKKVKKAEFEAFAKMTGTQSRVSPAAHSELQKWEELFHLEVHGSRITTSLADEEWMKVGGLLQISPKPCLDVLANYMNRFCEISWMILRTFPLLQLKRDDFGFEWTQKWQVLDDSFLFAIRAQVKLRKPIATAIIELVENSFGFSPKTTSYPPE